MYIVKIDTQESENFCTVQKKSAITSDISYLGPCSEMMANKLYRELTSKNDNRQGSLKRRKDWYLKDFEKGVHRFARLLSFSEDVNLVEYTKFELKIYIISSSNKTELNNRVEPEDKISF